MKIAICVDQEGMPGVCNWNEVDKKVDIEYKPFNKIATDQVVAAINGAFDGGAKEVWVMDWHWTARNIDPEKMPNGVVLCRGWSGQPQGLIDNTFDGVAFIGYHSEWGSPANPLSHTIRDKLDFVKLDGQIVGEFEKDSRMTSCYGIPTILLAGDEGLADRYKDANFVTVATTKGVGDSVVMIKTIDECKAALRDGMKQAVKSIRVKNSGKIDFGGKVELQIKFRKHQNAHKNSFYPGAEKIDSQTVKLYCANYYEVMRACMFMI